MGEGSMTALWTELSASDATGGMCSGKWNAARVEIDSRKVKAGDLFVAIKGEQFDGHEFVKDALGKGAVAAVVSRVPEGVDAKQCLIVPDCMRALEDLGREGRTRSSAKIVGVTGSVGKTSTKEMLKLVLSAHGTTYATTGNYNNHIGTPLNLANLPPDAQFGVFEMGMNHAEEIRHLTRMVRPHVAAITTVEAVHIEFFDSIEGIADAKSEIFDSMPAGGVAVLNRDNPHYARMLRNAGEYGVKIVHTFGAHEKADCRLIDYKPVEGGCKVTASLFGKHMQYGMQAVGRHWATTSLLALAVCHALGLDDVQSTAALSEFGELEGRGKVMRLRVVGGMAYLIDDSYNASPAAMHAAFAKTAEVWEGLGRKGRKFAALGNMLELGPEGPAMHASLAPDLQAKGFDKVFTAGDLMKHVHDGIPSALRAGHVTNAKDLLPLIERELKAGDVLLIKGSHGSKMYELAKLVGEKFAANHLKDGHLEKQHAV
ncbi:MAG: UDP-N-acetylmuramoyl-tripeptide--D-alanyl-D-alanine ligase [Rickettsiales bacterium]|nr:UDP-N-acetylmuramoyl-tripeptide--D-alanyl-D-alanine ligase [Rickettsiales bacterium]